MTFILPLPTVGHAVDNCTKVIWGSCTGNRIRTYSDVAWVKSGNEKATKFCYKTMVLNSNAFRKVNLWNNSPVVRGNVVKQIPVPTCSSL